MKTFLQIILFFIVVIPLCGQSYFPGKTYLSENEYIEYFAGNMPLILTVPHGGLLVPSNIPNRNCSECVTVTDANTQELSRLILAEIKKITGDKCVPHLIINRLRRSKLDANRDLYEAALGNTDAINAWNSFHLYIDNAKSAITKQFGKGLLIDLHGHGHANQRLELGYLLTGTDLRGSNTSLNNPTTIAKSSIRNLVLENKNQKTHAELLNGMESLGGFFDIERYASVPSPSDVAPRSGEDYFSGGYNTERHGSVDSGRIDAIQIECNYIGVRDNDVSMKFFAESTANALVKYLKTHYFGKDEFSCPTSITASNEDIQPVSFSVFPNPSCESVSLNLSQEGNIYVYNEHGRLLKQENFNTAGLHSLSFDFNDSLIFLHFIGKNGGVATTKFIRQCP